ncbi:uncharacterized protein METZ01_LOCUS416979, partial [marine metagenome]
GCPQTTSIYRKAGSSTTSKLSLN